MPPPYLRPSAAAGTERIIVLACCAIRAGTLVQMLPSAKLATEVSPHPALAMASWGLAAAATLGFVLRSFVRRGPVRRWETAVDCGLACALLIIGGTAVPADVRVGSWLGFQPGYALSVVVSNAACPSLWALGTGLAAVLIGKVAYVWSAVSRNWLTTVVGDFLTVIVLAAIAVAVVRYLRRLAAEADVARSLAALDEQRRASMVFHNPIAMMGLLTEPDLDPDTRSVIQQQARQEIRRVRSYLRGDVIPADTTARHSVRLASLLAEAADGFGDLSPNVLADLAEETQIDAADAEALSAAVTSLLLNIRRHAKASATVIHADDQDGEWTITVHDDGIGFDPAEARLGVGLAHVVIGGLQARSMGAVIDSMPGLGTTVTLTGRSLR